MQPQSNPFGASREDHQDFVERFRQGPQAVSEEEAASRYEQVAPNLPPEVYQRSAQEVLAQLTPAQRMQLGQALIQSAREQGQSFPDVNQDGIDDRLQDPDYLARTTTQAHQKEPGLLGQLFGSSGGHSSGGTTSGGMLSSPLAKGVLGGIAAYGLSRMLGGKHHGGLFSGQHRHHRHGHHGGFELDDLFEGGDDEGGFFGGEDKGFFGGDD